MKYLVFGCDPVGDGVLWEENDLRGSTLPVALPPDLVADMLAWNEKMAGAVLAATEANEAIKRLNEHGESLARRVAAAVPDGAKVRYRSE